MKRVKLRVEKWLNGRLKEPLINRRTEENG